MIVLSNLVQSHQLNLVCLNGVKWLFDLSVLAAIYFVDVHCKFVFLIDLIIMFWFQVILNALVFAFRHIEVIINVVLAKSESSLSIAIVNAFEQGGLLVSVFGVFHIMF